MKTAARWAGYVLFFIVATLLFVYITFPTDKAKGFAEDKLLEATGAERVEIEDLSLAGIGGVTLSNVMVELPALDMPTLVPDVTKPGPVRLLQLEELEVDASVGALLAGQIEADFEGVVQGGTLSKGHYERAKDEDGGSTHVLRIGEIADVAFGSEQIFQQLIGKDIVGSLNGTIEAKLPEKVGADGRRGVDLGKLQAGIELMIRDAVLKAPIFATPMGQVQLTDAELGDVVLKIAADRASNLDAFKKTARRRGDDTIIHIAEGSVRGPDLEVEVAKNSAITISPGKPLKDASVNIHLAVRVMDAFIDKTVPDPNNPKKTTQPNKGLRHIMRQRPIAPVLQNGVFGVGITGRLGSPRVRLERSVVTGFAKRVRPNINRPDPSSGTAGEDEKKPATVTPTTRPAPRRVTPATAKERTIKRTTPAATTRVPTPTRRPGGGMGPPFDKIGQPPEPEPVEEAEPTEEEGEEELIEEGEEGEEGIEEGEEGAEGEEGEGEEGEEGEEGLEEEILE